MFVGFVRWVIPYSSANCVNGATVTAALVIVELD
jgi:hypothetical protein